MSFPFISSSSSTKNKRCAMEFGAEWGQGEVFDWCRRNLTSRTIKTLEIRITRDAVPHRFVVAHMNDGSICRFDRRPQTPQSVFIPAGPQGPDEEPSCRAADEACIINRAELVEIELSTHWEIQLNLPADTDVLLIISACFAIAQDKKARNYTLREYNCYFFSWTIVMLITRHLLPFTVPSPPAVESRFSSRLASRSAAVADVMAEALSEAGLDVVATFDSATSKSLRQSLVRQELAVWGIPALVVRGFARTCIKVHIRRVKKGLKDPVRFQLETRVVSSFRKIVETSSGVAEAGPSGARTVAHNQVVDAVENRLWLNELPADLRQPIHDEIIAFVWGAILDVFISGYSAMKPDEIHQGVRHLSLLQRLKYRLLGKHNVDQFGQIWSEALCALLQGAREAVRGQYQPGRTHGEMFDLAVRGGTTAALRAAQDVVRRTGSDPANPKRDKMWEFVWSVWDDVWERVLAITRPMIVDRLESTLADMVGWVVEDVVKELGDNESQKVQATIQFKKNRNKKQRLQGEGAELSLEVFQFNIAKFIQSVPGQTPEHYTNIAQAMSNAWNVSRRTYGPLDNVAP